MTHLIYGEDTLVLPFSVEGRSGSRVVARMSRLQVRDGAEGRQGLGTRGGAGPQAQAMAGGGEHAEGFPE